MRRQLRKRGEGEEIALGADKFGASLTIWQCTYSPSPLEKQTNLNVVTHTNISYQSWYWIGCNDYLVVVFASLKLTDNLINLIWIFKWFTTNQSVFLGVSFSEYYIDVKFHTDWRCSSNYREFGGKNQFHNYPNTGAAQGLTTACDKFSFPDRSSETTKGATDSLTSRDVLISFLKIFAFNKVQHKCSLR